MQSRQAQKNRGSRIACRHGVLLEALNLRKDTVRIQALVEDVLGDAAFAGFGHRHHVELGGVAAL
jgi:hypothetical protein